MPAHDGARKGRGAQMGYLLLAVAIATEIAATTCLKNSNGFTVPAWSVATVLLYAVCYYSLSRALLTVDLSVAYATWCAVGIVATTAISVVLFGERLNAAGLAGIGAVRGRRRAAEPQHRRPLKHRGHGPCCAPRVAARVRSADLAAPARRA